jgi:hypothetical protein
MVPLILITYVVVLERPASTGLVKNLVESGEGRWRSGEGVERGRERGGGNQVIKVLGQGVVGPWNRNRNRNRESV